jgi:two-component system, OmpR family, phosphate regulon sensor histidine kinase PhoR
VGDLDGGEYAVVGDRNCLTVLFDNLITNAIAYNRSGGEVRVTARRVPGEVVVDVRDTGPGIPPEALGLLFEEFFRVPTVAKDDGGGNGGGNGGEGNGRRRWRGTGLGLPICKRIVTELGGGIEVESEVDVGSTFRVHLPAYQEDRDGKERSGE